MDANAIGASIGAVALVLYSAVQTWRVGQVRAVAEEVKNQVAAASVSDLAKTNAELAEAYRLKAAEWKSAFELEHGEAAKYREYVHDKAQKDIDAHLQLVAENSELKARTDLTPLVVHMENQSKTNRELTETLSKLTHAVTALLERIPPIHPDSHHE